MKTNLNYKEIVLDAYMRNDFSTALRLEYLNFQELPIDKPSHRPLMSEPCICDMLDDDGEEVV